MRAATAIAVCAIFAAACASEAGYVRTGPTSYSLMTTQKSAEDAATAMQNRAVDLCGHGYQMTPVKLITGSEKVSASADLTCLAEASSPAPAAAAPAPPPAAEASPSAPPAEQGASPAVPTHL